MDNRSSVAPTERVNIRYKSCTGGSQEEVELPLKILVLGDYTGCEDPRLVEERKPVRIDKDSFEDVLEASNVRVAMAVPNHLGSDGGLQVNLRVQKLSDLTPDGIVGKIPELREMLAMREALSSLRGPLGNRPEFRRLLQKALSEPSSVATLTKQLELGSGEGVE